MSFARTAGLLSAAPLAWAAHFLAIYGYTGLACARAAPASVPWVIGALTLVAFGVCGLVLRHALPRRESFEHWLAATSCAAALLAITWEALTVLLVKPCG